MSVQGRIVEAVRCGATSREQVAAAAGVPDDDDFLREIARAVVERRLKMTKTADGHHLEAV